MDKVLFVRWLLLLITLLLAENSLARAKTPDAQVQYNQYVTSRIGLDSLNNDVYEVGFVGGAVLRGTGGHPLWSLDRDDWVSVRDLQVGERLQTAEGAVSVEALEKVRGLHRVYNLEDHEYLVGEAGVRAHNQSFCSGGQRLLGPGRPASVVRGRLETHELAFAEEIVGHRGGTFVGATRRSYPGIDGHIDGIPAALKETQGGLSAVLRHASKAEAQNLARGNVGVELFIKARNVNSTTCSTLPAEGL